MPSKYDTVTSLCCVFLVVMAVVALALVFSPKKKDNFAQVSYGDNIGSLRVRSDGDYYSDPSSNPHLRNDQCSYYKPLDSSYCVDLQSDERKKLDGTLLDQYRNDTNLFGDNDFLPADERSRSAMYREGEMDHARGLAAASSTSAGYYKSPSVRRPTNHYSN